MVGQAHTLYVITGISRLTGERVAVTTPADLMRAKETLIKLRDRRHRQSAYTRLQLQAAVHEGNLFS